MDTVSYYVVFTTFYSLGFVLTVLALWRSRTPQGATAWIIGLISFPFVAIPLFLVFGRNKFNTYVSRRKLLDKYAEDAVFIKEKSDTHNAKMPDEFKDLEAIIKQTHDSKFLKNNDVEILINGQDTYDKMFEAIENAKEYILFQFYIIQNDKTGRRFKDLLIKKAKQGVKVYFLYDSIGSWLTNRFIKSMEKAGVEVCPFKSKKLLWTNKFQINFRNHRKLIVIDGHSAFIGGFNIGNEYLGKSKLGFWRDTHLLIQGPAATFSQVSFVKDWYWANQEIPKLNWSNEYTSKTDKNICVLHTGPADKFDICQLTHIALVNMCKDRLIITTPYFVPSESFLNALTMAALKGRDITIILPSKNDNRVVQAAEKVYIERLIAVGVKFYKYKNGFMHQKVMLIDDHTSVIGSANLDSRSFFINFEIFAIMNDKNISKEVEDMLMEDLKSCDRYDSTDLKKRYLVEKVLSRAANLFSPML